MGRATAFFFARPLGKGQMVIYHLILITKSISKMFIPNFVCVLTNERNKTYRTGFLFCCLGHALGVWLGGLRVQESNSVPSSVRYISSWIIGPNSTKWSVWVTHMHGACNSKNKFGPGEGSKGQIISITKSISKIFIPYFVCVLTN